MEDVQIDKWVAGDLRARGPELRRRLAAEAMELAGAVEGAHERVDLPSPVVCYEIDGDHVSLVGGHPFSLRSPAGDGQPTLRAEVTRRRLGENREAVPFQGPSCLVGLAGGGTTELLLDLAAASVTAVVGSETAVEETLVELARQAASGAFTAPTRTVVVGRELRPLADSTEAIPVGRIEECVEMLRRMESTGRVASDGPPMVVVVSREAFRGASATTLVTYAQRRAWLVVVLPTPVAAARALVTAVGGEHSVYIHASSGHEAEAAFGDSLEGAVAMDPPVEVAVLGQIEVRGASGSLERRPKLTELIVYLAMHPEGASSATWQAALWPERRVPAQTVANRLSEARRLLGMELDGRPRLRLSAERHRLAGVTTDWERFRVLADPRREPTSWRQALELVRGRPFDDLQQGQWTFLEGFTGEIETAIIECALRYGELRLAEGDAEAAAWAGQRAMRANPYDERLHRMLMRAADAAGNRSGVDAIYRNLLLVLDIDGDGAASVHPETEALYRRLSGNRAESRS